MNIGWKAYHNRILDIIEKLKRRDDKIRRKGYNNTVLVIRYLFRVKSQLRCI